MRIFIYALVALFIIGCGNETFKITKDMKEDKDIKFYKQLPSEIKSYDKEFITLKNGQYIDKNGLSEKSLEEGYSIISTDLEKKYNILKINNIDTKFESMIVTASKKDNLVAIIFADNHFELYNIDKNKTVIKNKFDRVYGVSNNIAKPIFYNNLLIVPTLNGKLSVYDIEKMKYVTDIVVSNKEFFSNIIYFDIKNDYLIAASKDSIISRGTNFVDKYNINIKSVVSDEKHLYIFTTSGKILKMEFNLKKVKEKEFKFINFISPFIYKDRLFFGENSNFSYLFSVDKNLEDVKYNYVNISLSEDIKFLGDKLYYFNEYVDLKEIIE
jgi:hypothetical protein